MHLEELNIKNFRKLRDVRLRFRSGLNVLVGPNNVGKSAVVDALRALLAGHEEPYPRFTTDDLHRSGANEPEGHIEFHYVFRGLDDDEEAEFMGALRPTDDGRMEAHVHVRYADADKTGRLRVERWCGDHKDVPLLSDMMENLRGVYLPPLRDASQALRPSRNSLLARMLHLLTDDTSRQEINVVLQELDEQLKQNKPIANTETTIAKRHSAMLGDQFAQVLRVGLSATDFQRLSSRLALTVDTMEVEQNGLGFNNLVYMAAVLSELARNPDAAYRGLIVEEPEAHLHPQLQAVLLSYLESLQSAVGETPVQLFVTSHSPNFACNADLDSLVCLVGTENGVETFFPRDVAFEKGKREKLERYLDVTRAELFFARRVIFVEGAAELMLISALAEREKFDLRAHGVSLISVEGLNFDSFLPLFGANALKMPVSVITDADPSEQVDADPDDPDSETQDEEEDRDEQDEGDGGPATGVKKKKKSKKKTIALYPALNETVMVSSNTAKMQRRNDAFVRIFHGVKTLEYDLALHPENREAMLLALSDIAPRIAQGLRKKMAAEPDSTKKAKILFCGMFERGQANIQKGRFGQALAQRIADGDAFQVPGYILDAVKHACGEGGK